MRLGKSGKLQNLKARVATRKPPKERLEQLIGVLMGTDFRSYNGRPNDRMPNDRKSPMDMGTD